MKRLKLTEMDRIKRKYPLQVLKEVKYCRDDIRGLKNQYVGYDDSEIEEKIGDYLDEIYEAYQKSAEKDYGLPESEFDHIYEVFEEEWGPIKL